MVRFAESLKPRLLGVPGVLDAAAVNVVPLNGYRATVDVWPADRPNRRPINDRKRITAWSGPATSPRSECRCRRGAHWPRPTGNALNPWSSSTAPSRALLAGPFAVGEYLMLRDDRDDTIRRARVVGTAGDVKHFGLETESTPDVYVPIAQVPETTIAWLMNNMYWGVRTDRGSGCTS